MSITFANIDRMKNKTGPSWMMDRRGGIEGLPMELLIIIVVATLGTAIVVGWMGNVENQEPSVYGTITSDVTMVSTDGEKYGTNGDTVCNEESFDLNVHVPDSKGDGIKDAVVTLSGLGVTGTKLFGQTDADGNISFTGLKLMTHNPGNVGYIVVGVSSSIGDSDLKIPVVMS